MNRHEADPFLQGYLDAIPDWFIERARKDCAAFTAQNCALLVKAGDPWRNGADFWCTRNGHGVGFWDRGYPDEIANPLTEAAHKFGEVYDFCAEDFGLVTKE